MKRRGSPQNQPRKRSEPAGAGAGAGASRASRAAGAPAVLLSSRSKRLLSGGSSTILLVCSAILVQNNLGLLSLSPEIDFVGLVLRPFVAIASGSVLTRGSGNDYPSNDGGEANYYATDDHYFSFKKRNKNLTASGGSGFENEYDDDGDVDYCSSYDDDEEGADDLFCEDEDDDEYEYDDEDEDEDDDEGFCDEYDDEEEEESDYEENEDEYEELGKYRFYELNDVLDGSMVKIM